MKANLSNPVEDYIVKYCVNVGNGLGRVKNKKSTLHRLKPDFLRKRERAVPKLLKPTFEPH